MDSKWLVLTEEDDDDDCCSLSHSGCDSPPLLRDGDDIIVFLERLESQLSNNRQSLQLGIFPIRSLDTVCIHCAYGVMHSLWCEFLLAKIELKITTLGVFWKGGELVREWVRGSFLFASVYWKGLRKKWSQRKT